MRIVTISYKRAGNIQVRKIIPETVLAVHKFEVDEYREKEGGEVLEIPDELRGNIARVRNWVLDNVKDEWILMVDDDVNRIGYCEEGVEHWMIHEEIMQMIENGFVMCEDLGTKLWGLNQNSDPKFYHEYSPFSLVSVVLAPFHGIINNTPLRYDERLGLKEDYDFSVQVIFKHRKLLRFNKYHYQCGHIRNDGGAVSYRTKEEERKQAMIFRRKWGSRVVHIHRKTQGGNLTINPIIKIPLRGI